MIARPVALPTVVTINDLSWHYQPSWHPAERLHWIERNLPATLRQASRFVAISQFTKDAVVAELGIAAERIDVVPLAPAAEFQPGDRRTRRRRRCARYDLRGPRATCSPSRRSSRARTSTGCWPRTCACPPRCGAGRRW